VFHDRRANVYIVTDVLIDCFSTSRCVSIGTGDNFHTDNSDIQLLGNGVRVEIIVLQEMPETSNRN
jgi:hypothetical protein